jgi:hypothetical protein
MRPVPHGACGMSASSLRKPRPVRHLCSWGGPREIGTIDAEPNLMVAMIYTQALFVIADSGYRRGAGVMLAFLRTFLSRRRFVRLRMGWVEVVCTFEPLVLLAVTYLVQTSTVPVLSPTLGQLSAAVLGAVMASPDGLCWPGPSSPGVHSSPAMACSRTISWHPRRVRVRSAPRCLPGGAADSLGPRRRLSEHASPSLSRAST